MREIVTAQLFARLRGLRLCQKPFWDMPALTCTPSPLKPAQTCTSPNASSPSVSSARREANRTQP
jgi:hypothetical protein